MIANALAGAAAPARAKASPGEVVLVVEDNAALLETVQRQLAQLGYATLAAGDAHAALLVLESAERIDLLFTDIVLPGRLDGRSLARAALERRPGLRCLLTTGFDPEMAGRSVPAQLPVLEKPYRREQLALAVRAVLDQPE
jgi:CheY-like chemotaxis protein